MWQIANVNVHLPSRCIALQHTDINEKASKPTHG
jgi:hypothetical protein